MTVLIANSIQSINTQQIEYIANLADKWAINAGEIGALKKEVEFKNKEIEDLNVNRMLHNHCLSKSISDASWSMFSSILSYKAVDAGRTVVKVNPAYTSQDCSSCGHREKKSLSVRTHSCKCCGLTINRDLNASLNILRIGLDSLGSNTIEATCACTVE